MAELKTRPDDAASVEGFILGIGDESRRQDCFALVALMSEVTGAAPRLWGTEELQRWRVPLSPRSDPL